VACFYTCFGGLLVGLMRHFFLTQERHHGVAGIMEAVAIAGGRLRYQRTPLKALAAAFSIGTGASVGPEDPSVQIGANIGSMIGQLSQLSTGRIRVLVATGAAAGIAAAFNAPIAGVFFAIEIILGELTTGAFGMIVLGSVISAVLTRAMVGPNPAFAIPAYAYNGPLELPFYFLLGVLAVPVSLVYVRAIYGFQDWFHKTTWPRWISPIFVGLLIGIIGLRYPQLLGDSYSAIADILFGRNLLPSLLLILLILKLLLTSLSIGAGFVGGVFAPSLFLGAALGGAFGSFIDQVVPQLQIHPSAFALVGMAAVLAGTIRAPITAIMLLFEMTNDYRIFLPLMFAVVISVFASERFFPFSVYTLSLARKGIHLRQGRDIDLLESLLVKDVMESAPGKIPDTKNLGDASQILVDLRSHGLPVVDNEGLLSGVLTIQDIETAMANDPVNAKRRVLLFCTKSMQVTYPDESVQQAVAKMIRLDIGRLPVVDRTNPQKLVGWLRRSTVMRAYDLARIRLASDQHTGGQIRLGAISGAEVIEMTIGAESAVAGKKMAEIPWPKDCVVASIQRGWNLVIPRGNTQLLQGDRLAIVVDKKDQENLRRLLIGE
jgi:chloride channel protein, CIC family